MKNIFYTQKTNNNFVFLFSILFLFVFILLNPVVFAQKMQFDNRIEEHLTDLNLKYEKNVVSGDYTFFIKMGNGQSQRTQQVFVQSATINYHKLEIREIFSVIYRSKIPPNAQIIRDLMMDTSEKQLGGWELLFEAEEYFIIFNAKISANLDLQDLSSVINLVALSADEMEKKVFAEDVF